MLKTRSACLVGLAVASVVVALSAAPVKAESKVSQCKRFYQTMGTFVNQIAPAFKEVSQAKTPETFSNSIDRALKISQRGLKQIEGRKFSDRNLQAFQNQGLNIYIDLHNIVAKAADAVDSRDRSTFEQSLQKIKPIIQREDKLQRQVMQYCKLTSK